MEEYAADGDARGTRVRRGASLARRSTVVLGLLSTRHLLHGAPTDRTNASNTRSRRQPSGLGWLPDGDLLCVSMTDQKVLRFHGDEVTTFADIC